MPQSSRSAGPERARRMPKSKSNTLSAKPGSPAFIWPRSASGRREGWLPDRLLRLEPVQGCDAPLPTGEAPEARVSGQRKLSVARRVGRRRTSPERRFDCRRAGRHDLDGGAGAPALFRRALRENLPHQRAACPGQMLPGFQKRQRVDHRAGRSVGPSRCDGLPLTDPVEPSRAAHVREVDPPADKVNPVSTRTAGARQAADDDRPEVGAVRRQADDLEGEAAQRCAIDADPDGNRRRGGIRRPRGHSDRRAFGPVVATHDPVRELAELGMRGTGREHGEPDSQAEGKPRNRLPRDPRGGFRVALADAGERPGSARSSSCGLVMARKGRNGPSRSRSRSAGVAGRSPHGSSGSRGVVRGNGERARSRRPSRSRWRIA